MKHLTEEELVAKAFGERDGEAAAERHLAGCEQCAGRYAALMIDLAALKPVSTPERDAGYGDRVWASLVPTLPVYAADKRRWLSPVLNLASNPAIWKGLVYAGACALLVGGAFVAGRNWDQWTRPRIAAENQSGLEAKQPVVLVVLGDHLDRSERLLVELKHADAGSAEMVSPMRDEARSLLAANQVCRQDASQIGDPALETALDRLDPLLTELANQPGGLNRETITRLQTEMNADGLLFEVRVLRARLPDRLPDAQAGAQAGGAGRTPHGGTI